MENSHCFIKKWVDCGIFPQLVNTWDLIVLQWPTMNSKQISDCSLYNGILARIKGYQQKLGSKLKGSFVVGDAPVWKCQLKTGAKFIVMSC